MSKLVDQIVSDDDDDEYDDIDDDEGEEVEANLKVLSLFDENRFFDDLKSLYRYEMENNGFNLVEIIKKFQLDMLSYIKMINFIRKTVLYDLSLISFFSILDLLFLLETYY